MTEAHEFHHPDGTICIFVKGHGWFLPPGEDGTAYSCTLEHPPEPLHLDSPPTTDMEYAVAKVAVDLRMKLEKAEFELGTALVNEQLEVIRQKQRAEKAEARVAELEKQLKMEGPKVLREAAKALNNMWVHEGQHFGMPGCYSSGYETWLNRRATGMEIRNG